MSSCTRFRSLPGHSGWLVSVTGVETWTSNSPRVVCLNFVLGFAGGLSSGGGFSDMFVGLWVGGVSDVYLAGVESEGISLFCET